MKPLKLGLDLDGVFANFNDAFMRELIQVTGHDKRPVLPEGQTWEPSTWNWMADLGYSKTEVERTWASVDRQPLWWATLDPLQDAHHALIEISSLIGRLQVEAVFMTTRHSPTAHAQSVAWLRDRFAVRVCPQVCICANSESKGLMTKALHLDLVLDDYTPNLLASKRHSPETRVVLFDRRWNQGPIERAGLDVLGYQSVSGLVPFLMLIDAILKERG